MHQLEVLVGEGARSLLRSALGEPGSLGMKHMLCAMDFSYSLQFEHKTCRCSEPSLKGASGVPGILGNAKARNTSPPQLRHQTAPSPRKFGLLYNESTQISLSLLQYLLAKAGLRYGCWPEHQCAEEAPERRARGGCLARLCRPAGVPRFQAFRRRRPLRRETPFLTQQD